jgi:hypothetical protein
MSTLATASLLGIDDGLKRHWLRALGASAAAIEAASRAHVLPAEAARRSGSWLAAERAWLEIVDWSAVELVSDGSIATFESPAEVAQPPLVKAA